MQELDFPALGITTLILILLYLLSDRVLSRFFLISVERGYQTHAGYSPLRGRDDVPLFYWERIYWDYIRRPLWVGFSLVIPYYALGIIVIYRIFIPLMNLITEIPSWILIIFWAYHHTTLSTLKASVKFNSLRKSLQRIEIDQRDEPIKFWDRVPVVLNDITNVGIIHFFAFNLLVVITIYPYLAVTYSCIALVVIIELLSKR